MKVKWIGRYDPSNGLIRLVRLMWQKGQVGDGSGYSGKLTFGVIPTPSLYSWQCDSDGWIFKILIFRIHYQRSFGGIFV